MGDLDFSDLSDDQLIGLIRSALQECVSRSDGQPDDEAAALAAAARLGGRIDCIFCGPDSDAAGRDFLARLARLGCGTFVRCDLARTPPAGLAIEARRVLGLPAPKG